MLIKSSSDIRSSEITPEKDYLNRRAFMKGAVARDGKNAEAGADSDESSLHGGLNANLNLPN